MTVPENPCYEAFVCPSCLQSLVECGDPDRPDVFECTGCSQLAPLWYLRLMGIHECEREEQTTIFERHRSVPHTELDPTTLKPLREYGRSRNLEDYADMRALLADGYEWQPE